MMRFCPTLIMLFFGLVVAINQTPSAMTTGQQLTSSNIETLEGSNDPIGALNAYYSAINAKNYQRAYRYWERPSQTFEQFRRGFSDTKSVRFFVDPSYQIEGAAGSSYVSLSILLLARHSNGVDESFGGCYDMRKSNLTPEDGQTRQGWRIFSANVSSLPASAKLSVVLTQTCVK